MPVKCGNTLTGITWKQKVPLNFCKLQDYTDCNPEDRHLHTFCHGNLKSYKTKLNLSKNIKDKYTRLQEGLSIM